MNALSLLDGLEWDIVNDWLPEALMTFDRDVYGHFEAEPIVGLNGCSIDGSEEVVGYVIKGKHVAPGALRLRVAWDIGELLDCYDGYDVRRCYGRLVPYSLMYPDAEPCGDEEAEVWEFSDKPLPHGEPVTVMETA